MLRSLAGTLLALLVSLSGMGSSWSADVCLTGADVGQMKGCHTQRRLLSP